MAAFSKGILRTAAVVLLSAAAACTVGPPVQEMSNARQVIRAARDAGASTLPNNALDEAERLLSEAEAKLQQGHYREARRDALAARSKAAEALRVVQARSGDRRG